MTPGRLPSSAGQLIDRSKPLSFTFDGRAFAGYAGDTITSALLAAGVRVLSRSFKYHRPRGTLSAAGHDANSFVQVGDEPNVVADTRLIEDGMVVEAQNVFGSLDNDKARLLDHLGRFLPVGFYYKTFYRPKGAWKVWEPVVRRLAGLGTVIPSTPHGYYDKQYLWADVVVVGGGPAGMAAALEAAAVSGTVEVLLVEENPCLGGSLTYARFDAEGERAARERATLVAAVEGCDNIRVLVGAAANGWFTDHFIPVIQGNRMFKVRAGSVVVATGSWEQPLVFRNNDLPGVMYGSAAQRLVNRYGVRPGSRAVIATANADGYACALDLIGAGVDIAAVAELGPAMPRHDLAVAVADHGVPIMPRSTVVEAEPGPWKDTIEAARIAEITGPGTTAARHDVLDCDTVVTSVGWQPAANLVWHAGGRTPYNETISMLEVGELPGGMHAAGSVAGCFRIDTVIEEGRRAGWLAARDAGFNGAAMPAVRNDRGETGQNHPWPMFEHPKGRDFVDFDEDLQIHDLKDAVSEGYTHIELMKRFSTCGMGPSQGRHSWLNAIRINARENGISVNEAGMTTQRPPYTAEKLGVLAGRSFEPERLTAMHWRHVEAGARMMQAGVWYRPEHYGGDDRDAVIDAESRHVRGKVGLIDVSTLGGLEIRGPDAADMMERMYTWAYRKQLVGRARYTLMTDMTGVITDDGVACRLHENHYYVTATTSGVDGVYQEMLFWNAQWRLRVDITNVTGALCGVNIAGPRSRAVLTRLTDEKLDAESFPYMAVRQANVAGIPCRLLRVGFVGELGYEVHCPAHSGEALWDALMEAGRDHDIRPFGVECQRLLRLEKGHIIVSQDTDGLTNPLEADMDWALAKKRPFFIGKRSIDIQRDNVQRKLVGFEIESRNGHGNIPRECHLVIRDGDITGRVTSCSYSPTLDKVIGLAYVAPDQAEPGSTFQVRINSGRVDGRRVRITPDTFVACRVVPLPFYDPENARQEPGNAGP